MSHIGEKTGQKQMTYFSFQKGCYPSKVFRMQQIFFTENFFLRIRPNVEGRPRNQQVAFI